MDSKADIGTVHEEQTGQGGKKETILPELRIWRSKTTVHVI